MMKFLVASLICGAINAFTSTRPHIRQPPSRLFAADGAPQYDKSQGTLRQAEEVGGGSVMLHIDTQDVVQYEPGHVLALEVQPHDGAQEAAADTDADATENGGWMRGPYTVSRSTDTSIDILIKVVGDKSKRFASAKPGTPLQFGGKFKVPILDGIAADTTKRVVLISTGVGVGPCIGAIEKALERESFPPIELISSYRTEAEVVYKDHLNKLKKEHPDNLSCTTIITSEQGRLSASTENLRSLTWFHAGFDNTHYHLIGNAQMVSEFKAGLGKAGVPEDKITLESYFNHKVAASTEVVDRIAAAITEAAASTIAW